MDKVEFFQKRVYSSQKEARLLQAIFDLIIDGIAFTLYMESFERLIKNKENDVIWYETRDWYFYTKNSYYDMAILNWTKLFGAHSEPTHYYQLNKNVKIKEILLKISILKSHNDCGENCKDCKKELKNKLLKCAKISDCCFNKIHKIIKGCRDKYISHREHHPEKIKTGDVIFPEVSPMKETFLSLYFILKKIIEELPESPSENGGYRIKFYAFADRGAIVKYFERSIPNF